MTALEPRQGEMSGVSRAYLRRQLSEEGPRATVAARRVAHIKIPVGPQRRKILTMPQELSGEGPTRPDIGALNKVKPD